MIRVREIVEAWGMSPVEVSGFEADDIIATVVAEARAVARFDALGQPFVQRRVGSDYDRHEAAALGESESHRAIALDTRDRDARAG